MYEEIMDSLILISLERQPTFSGKFNEDVIYWLKDITHGLNFARFSDDEKVLVVSRYIKGDARRWLIENIAILESWQIFTEAMMKMFAPTISKEVAVSQANQFVQVVDEIMICDDKDMKAEEKEKEEAGEDVDYFSTILDDSNKVVLMDMCIKIGGEASLEAHWPDGDESWFMHNELPQRPQFFVCVQQEISYNSTTSTDNDFPQEKLLSVMNIVISYSTNSRINYSVNNDSVFDNLLQIQKFCSAVISFILLLNSWLLKRMDYRRTFNGDSRTLYFCRNDMSYDIEDRDWFRSLTVP